MLHIASSCFQLLITLPNCNGWADIFQAGVCFRIEDFSPNGSAASENKIWGGGGWGEMYCFPCVRRSWQLSLGVTLKAQYVLKQGFETGSGVAFM